ncbi:MAG: hypothetical protein LJE67_07420 [Salaquimonas sp.]|nr:hypothetical protein [Salaquimonas sp.]
MRRVGFTPLFGLLLVFLLSACVESKGPLLTGMRPGTPLPAAFVIVNVEGKPEAGRFDRDEDTYVTLENGVTTVYRLMPMEDLIGPTGPFYIGVETKQNDHGANYGLVEIAPGELVVHSFDDEALAAELGLKADKFGIEVETDEQLLSLFQRVAEDARRGETKVARFKVLDLADPAQRAEADKALEETRKAKEAE